MVAEILQHLVQRPEDYLENIENTVQLYKEMILQPLEVRTRCVADNGNACLCVLFTYHDDLIHVSASLSNPILLLSMVGSC